MRFYGAGPLRPLSGINLDSHEQVLDLVDVNGIYAGFKGGFHDGSYGYLVPHNAGAAYSGKLVRFELSTFGNVEVLDLAGEDPALKGYLGTC